MERDNHLACEYIVKYERVEWFSGGDPVDIPLQQQRSKKREVNHVELIIRNKNGDKVFRIDKDGNLSMKGEIVAQGR